VLGNLGRRAIDLAVLLLALYAFAFVPLGHRTGLEHLRAILGTRAAKDAGHEMLEAAERLRERLLGEEPEQPVKTHGRAVVPRLPRHEPANAALAPNALSGSLRDAPDASL